MSVKSIPGGYHSVTPYLVVKDAARALAFYKEAFGAKEFMRLQDPSGKIAHAEFKIGDSPVMIGEEVPQMGFLGPGTLGGSPVCLLIYVEGVDAMTSQAAAAGAKILRPVQDQFYGDRTATLEDPFGHLWTIATHIEDVPPDEMRRRFEASHKQHANA